MNDLHAKYVNRSVPRYTSYPTAPHFRPAFPETTYRSWLAELDPTQPTLTVCNSAYRSSMALGLLEREGFQDLYNLDGGAEAWITAGLPVLGPRTSAAVPGPSTPRREVRRPPLPEPQLRRPVARVVKGAYGIGE